MVDSINAVNKASNAGYAVNHINALTEETKKKLESLGINTDNIKTETQGQQMLREAQAAQASHSVQPQNNFLMQSVARDVKIFADKIGVTIASTDTMTNILDKLHMKIREMKETSGTDISKKSQADSAQFTCDSLYNRFLQADTSPTLIRKGLDALANYNRAALGL